MLASAFTVGTLSAKLTSSGVNDAGTAGNKATAITAGTAGFHNCVVLGRSGSKILVTRTVSWRTRPTAAWASAICLRKKLLSATWARHSAYPCGVPECTRTASSQAISRSSDSLRSIHHTLGRKKNNAFRTFCAMFVQSSRRRRCASSCSKIYFNSSTGVLSTIHLGRITAALRKPIAVGTSNRSETSTETGRDFWTSSIKECSSAGRDSIARGSACGRNLRSWKVASTTRAKPAAAITAQATNPYHAIEVETVNTAVEPPGKTGLLSKYELNSGNIAVASKVENQMAKFVRESLLGKSCKRSQTAAASSVPLTALNNKRCEITVATPWKSRFMIFPCALAAVGPDV